MKICVLFDEEQLTCMRCGHTRTKEIPFDPVHGIRLDDPRTTSLIGGHGVQMLYRGKSSRLEPLLSSLTQEYIDKFHRAIAQGKADAEKSILISFSHNLAKVVYGPIVPGIHLMDYSQFFSHQVVLEPAAFIEFWHDSR